MDAYRDAMIRHPEYKDRPAYKPEGFKTLYIPLVTVPGEVKVLKVPVHSDSSEFVCRYSHATSKYQQQNLNGSWVDNSDEFEPILKAAHRKKYGEDFPAVQLEKPKQVPVKETFPVSNTSKKGTGMNFKNLALMSMVMGGGFGGGATAPGGINPMMLMLMNDDKKGGMDDMLPLLLMSGSLGGAAPAANNPMMLMMLMGDDCDMDMKEMLKKTLFLQMFPEATDVERGLVAEGNYKAFLTLQLAKAGLVKKPAEKKA
jgi:hypothetical protein